MINTVAEDVNKDKRRGEGRGGGERGSGGGEKGKEHGVGRGREGYSTGSKMGRRCQVRPGRRLGDFTGSGTVFHASGLD